MSGYPVTLVDLDRTSCVVIGGGEIAERKVTALREAGARPLVISPSLSDALRCQAEAGEIEAIEREYQTGDLSGARLVIAATDEPEINEAVWQEAQAVGCLVNVVDDPNRCDFYVPATIRRGALTISISTAGSSPLLAGRIRHALEQQFDPAYGPYLALLGELRPQVKELVLDPAHRKGVWGVLLDSNILDLLRAGQSGAAEQRAEDIIQTFCQTRAQ
ncbi:bifunctional precorrin-2 dehydrogenase/sirohydrochlorin ferrochelatase [Chloroflexota bacterium]